MYVEGERTQISLVQVLPYSTVCSFLPEKYTRRAYAKGVYPQSVATAVNTSVKIESPINPNITDRVNWSKRFRRQTRSMIAVIKPVVFPYRVREADSTMTCVNFCVPQIIAQFAVTELLKVTKFQ
jgi:hypothetical protein